MNQAIEKPGTAERYIAATNSSDLSLNPNARTDADVLIAAGLICKDDSRFDLALRFYRMKATGDMTPFRELSEIAGGWLWARSYRRGRTRLHGLQARDLATRVLFWWLNPICTACGGHGHPKMPNSPNINYGHDCGICHGTGQYPIQRIVPPGTADEARWLVDELDLFTGLVFAEMSRALAPRLELD